jgi:glycerol-3-phosphate acyltransferase PlsY
MRFRGGKGVATSFGVLLGLTPLVAAMAGLLWVAVLALSRYSSLASLAALLSVPVLMIVYHDPPIYIAFGVLAAAFALYRHRGNIQRLLQGKELALGDREARQD